MRLIRQNLKSVGNPCATRRSIVPFATKSRKAKKEAEEVLYDVDTGWADGTDDLIQKLKLSSSTKQSKIDIDKDLDDGALEDELSEALSSGWSVTSGDSDSDSDDEDNGKSAVDLHTSTRSLRRSMVDPDTFDPDELEEQALLSLSPRMLKQAKKDEEDALKETPARDPTRLVTRRNMRLQVVAGSAAGLRLFTPAGLDVRPMMMKVRGALFSMLLSGTVGRAQFPPKSRWLDVFAGTGAVGLEGLSRGCCEAHFVEMDGWVIRKCLEPNLEKTGFTNAAVVHQMKAEKYLRNARKKPEAVRAPFDYISLTPPYMEVSYKELFDLLEGSPLLHERSVVVVEYAAQNKPEIRQEIGLLKLVKSRRYGRTFLAIYANVTA